MIRSSFYRYYQLFMLLVFTFVSVLLPVINCRADGCLNHEGSGAETECNPPTDLSESKSKAESIRTYSFVGIEHKGFFIKGSVPRERAIELAGEGVQFVPAKSPERVRCALLVVNIEMDAAFKIPLYYLMGWNYPEAIWMLEIRKGSYLAIKAHTDSWIMKYVLAYSDQYNTSYGSMTLDKEGSNVTVSVRSEENLVFSATLSEAKRNNDVSLIENLWTKNENGDYYRIPWGTAKPAEAYSMTSLVLDSLGKRIFGDVIWDDNATYYLKRKHECSMAIPDKGSFRIPNCWNILY
ncbi:hypothetical protein [Salinisphaera sp. G21_0]|uniref:hypothetical protein n=1 Tax=Salinisphaera sp. G21_0 TaxID=2821094 RepID=UPI001ADAE324|nr:hypothetical protein [Salinisphaera sp. G21_0]MBO9484679.1 hypothetical protein [Salinisphaera sp. G21_0]